MVYEADDEEADRIYEKVDEAMDARRRARRCVHTGQFFCLILMQLLCFLSQGGTGAGRTCETARGATEDSAAVRGLEARPFCSDGLGVGEPP